MIGNEEGENKMRLSNREAKEFYEIWFKLLRAVNEKHNICPSVTEFVYEKDSTEEVSKIAEYIWTHPESIDEVIADNEKVGYNARELAALEAWRNKYVHSEFVIVEHRSNHTVFMDIQDDMHLYAVHGIFDSLKKIFPPRALPVLLKTTLLPFKNKIILDGSLKVGNPEDLEELSDKFLNSYRNAKKSQGTSFTLTDKE